MATLLMPPTPVLAVEELPEIVLFVMIAVASPLLAVRFWTPPNPPVELLPEMVLLLTVRNAGIDGLGDCRRISLSIPPAVLLLTVVWFTVTVEPLLLIAAAPELPVITQ